MSSESPASPPPPVSTPPAEPCKSSVEPAYEISIVPSVRTREYPPRSSDLANSRRFALRHLYLWVTCSAVDLSLLRQLIRDEPRLTGLALLSLHALFNGCVWMGMFVFAARSWTDRKPISQAGEWLSAIVGIRLVGELFLFGLAQDAFRSPHALLAALTSCVLVCPVFSRSMTWYWRLAFHLLILVQFAPHLLNFLGLFLNSSVMGGSREDLLPYLSGANILIVVIAIAGDGRENLSRGWLHWLGAGSWILFLGIMPLCGF